MIARTHQRRLLAPVRCLLLLSVLFSSAGCSLRERFAEWKTSEAADHLLITYKVKNAVHDLDPWSSFADRGLESASWTIDEDAEDTAQRAAALQIEYPHPVKGAEFALATLSVYDRPLDDKEFEAQPKKRWYHRLFNRSVSRGQADAAPSPSEVVTLPIPRTQFELLVNEMDRARYLDENHRSTGSLTTALLSISSNRKAVHESSIEDPRLNEVIQNVYRNGEVILGEKRHAAPSILQTSAFIEAPNPKMVN